jgi:hypothetical protein
MATSAISATAARGHGQRSGNGIDRVLLAASRRKRAAAAAACGAAAQAAAR